MKIGGTVGYASGDGQCDHEPLRFTAYHLAVTEHVVGELPELAFRSSLPSEDSLHRGGCEWHRVGRTSSCEMPLTAAAAESRQPTERAAREEKSERRKNKLSRYLTDKIPSFAWQAGRLLYIRDATADFLPQCARSGEPREDVRIQYSTTIRTVRTVHVRTTCPLLGPREGEGELATL